jgi:hypothetical protein
MAEQVAGIGAVNVQIQQRSPQRPTAISQRWATGTTDGSKLVDAAVFAADFKINRNAVLKQMLQGQNHLKPSAEPHRADPLWQHDRPVSCQTS